MGQMIDFGEKQDHQVVMDALALMQIEIGASTGELADLPAIPVRILTGAQNNFHSYSQLILLPWGWSLDEPQNIDNLYNMANIGNDALYAVNQKTFEVGCIPCLLYVASGGSLDYVLGMFGIPYSYAMELRDTGEYGFLLPPDQIIDSGKEFWAFHMAVARQLIKEFIP